MLYQNGVMFSNINYIFNSYLLFEKLKIKALIILFVGSPASFLASRLREINEPVQYTGFSQMSVKELSSLSEDGG